MFHVLTAAAFSLLFISKTYAQTVYLAGDSTMALGGGGNGTNGNSRT